MPRSLDKHWRDEKDTAGVSKTINWTISGGAIACLLLNSHLNVTSQGGFIPGMCEPSCKTDKILVLVMLKRYGLSRRAKVRKEQVGPGEGRTLPGAVCAPVRLLAPRDETSRLERS